jgi:hypothetical protein
MQLSGPLRPYDATEGLKQNKLEKFSFYKLENTITVYCSICYPRHELNC